MRAAEAEMDNKESDEIEYKNLFMEVRFKYLNEVSLRGNQIDILPLEIVWKYNILKSGFQIPSSKVVNYMINKCITNTLVMTELFLKC